MLYAYSVRIKKRKAYSLALKLTDEKFYLSYSETAANEYLFIMHMHISHIIVLNICIRLLCFIG